MSELLTNEATTYLTTEDVAARYRTAPSTIRYWRHIGSGPRGIKVGRRVLYSLAELERFERELADQPAKKESA
ncbi:helix-turn-helix domain-containing protein [Streptomyces sp. M2CJ-2]|uniref:helix-turn-helix transcriptional regulator n=1 Tax=Streptomyces sp. M2CJ-2 TaxID=2803948 RepID=UPI0027DD5E7C|nr:helix-turn-helix domain-containing protein [Streptomyces sp. M2CJ-2]